MSNRIHQMERVQDEGLRLFAKKNKDYGDSFATYGPVGVIVRIQDKINRLVSVSKQGITMVDNESLRDTLIDLHNYSAMAIMLMDEKDNTFIPIKSSSPESSNSSMSNVSEQIEQDEEDSKETSNKPASIEELVGYGFGC